MEPARNIRMKIDPYYQRQKYRLMILVSGNETHVQRIPTDVITV